MTAKRVLVGLSLALGIAALPTAADAASSCLQLQVNGPATVCEGRPSTLTGTLENSCPNTERATVSVSVDEQKLPGKAAVVVAGDATMSGQWTFTVPAKTSPGSHTLTVTLTDASGNQVTTDVTVDVSACSAN